MHAAWQAGLLLPLLRCTAALAGCSPGPPLMAPHSSLLLPRSPHPSPHAHPMRTMGMDCERRLGLGGLAGRPCSPMQRCRCVIPHSCAMMCL